MTASELIKELKKYPKDSPVLRLESSPEAFRDIQEVKYYENFDEDGSAIILY